MKTIQLLLILSLISLRAAEAPSPLVPGKFGRALDAREARPAAAAREAYVHPPLTVECWALLKGKDTFNLLVANEPKASGSHWEIYSYAGSGFFSVYLPGYAPPEIQSSRDIADGQWHYLALIFEADRARLYVDAQEVANQPISRQDTLPRQPGPLAFGTATAGYDLKCDGLIDEVRISHGARAIESIPTAPFAPDARTVGLWRMDKLSRKGEIADLSSLQNPAVIKPVERISMDELDRRSYHPGPSPLDSNSKSVSLKHGAAVYPIGPLTVSLDGQWQMAEGGAAEKRLGEAWPDAVPAKVPGSVHSALYAAGKIPDPKFGRNDSIAHEQSFKTWWFKRSFPRPQGTQGEKLVFDGVAIRCTVWLNGQLLGSHDGMFGGPEFNVADCLRDENSLVVKLDPAPGDPKAWNNPDWRTTVVFNNVWGWHYSSIPALGIWRSVRVEAAPGVRLGRPFVAARDAQKGLVDLVTELQGPPAAWAGSLSATVEPENFSGDSHHFVQGVKSQGGAEPIHLRFRIPEPRLWWPNDLGLQNLYRLKLSFVPDGGGVADFKQTTFGLRAITMAPLPDGPRANSFNWTFVINKRPVFVKGAGWCTMDSSMDFSRERYDRFLTLARLQHVQMLRAWGSGMPETDDFYDLCDRKGLLVLQEWPTAWDSHLVQPYDILEETVRCNTLRLRNHPSLAMYDGGNESGNPFGKAIDMMGRCAIELDGTRPFHRGEPWGGSQHNYDCYWGRQPLDHNLNMTAVFWGEFGLACMPVYESVLRYLPQDEQGAWPPPKDGSLIHHTPIFGTADDWSRLSQYSACFVEPADLKTFIVGSQLSQALGVRHTLERARTRWPDCSGALYYKMNDNYPAASWSCADWYGAPKLSHYFFQAAFAPLHACVLFDSVNNRGKAVSWPVFLLDDADALKGAEWETVVRAYDAKLTLIKAESYRGGGSISAPRKLGQFTLAAQQTDTSPLLVVAEVKRGGALADRTFYWVNYEKVKGSLFKLPRATLSLQVKNGQAVVSNTGLVPAVGAAVLRPGHLDTFTADENYFWLDPGESKTVGVNAGEGLQLSAWNL
jgi:beta-mannosidase